MRLFRICGPASRLIIFIALVPFLNADRQFDEYQIKAGFLLNFARFVDWPPEVFATGQETVPICIWEPDPFGPSLDKAAVQQTIAGHPIEIRRIAEPGLAAGCRVLFARSVSRHDTSFLRERFVLVVSEKGSDAASAAAINFTLDDGKVRFEVNLVPVQRANLHLSARLLSLAATVKKS
jgi:hypothetical protein